MTDQALALSLITLLGIALLLGMLSRAGSTERSSGVSVARRGGDRTAPRAMAVDLTAR